MISADQPNAEHPRFVTALARGLAILRCFECGAQYLDNYEIAAATGLPNPTVSRLTFTLTSLGYLTYSPAQEKYAVGMTVLSLDWNPDLFAVGVPMASADGSRIFVFNISGRISQTTREALIHDLGPALLTLRNTVYSITQGHFLM